MELDAVVEETMDKISCVMLTFNRLQHFKRSLRCFVNQDYSNKELIVVTHGSKEYVTQLQVEIAAVGLDGTDIVVVPAGMPLGALRNVSIRHAQGPLVCQWDDDDLNHRRRLSVQVEQMLEARAYASFLSDQFHLFYDSSSLYWCDWSRSLSHKGIPGTLLAYKDVLPRYEEGLSRGEDSDVQWKLAGMGIRANIVQGHGYLSIYTCHGSNTFERSHHEALVKSYGMETATLRDRETLICEMLRQYPITIPLSVRDNSHVEVFRYEVSGEALRQSSSILSWMQDSV